MASYVYVKNPNGTTYVYENTSVWNKEKKRADTFRKAVGKLDPVTGEIIYNKATRIPKMSTKYGSIYFLDELAKRIGLDSILKNVFDNYEELITAVHYMICEDSSLSNCGRWIETTDVLTNKKLSSQRMTELLRSITDEKILDFFKSWVKYRTEQEYIAYDITSISSYSEFIELVEYGYNRDKESLPQINMGMFFGETSKLPIFYNIFQGSIKDVKTLSNILIYTDILNITDVKYVMDKGFYSDRNINDMLVEKKKFTIAVPFKNMKAIKAVEKVKDYIRLPENSIGYGEELIYGVTEEMKWPVESPDGTIKETKVYMHIFYDEDKRNERETKVIGRVNRLKAELEGLTKKPKDTSKYNKYFELRQLKNKIKISVKNEAIQNELKHEGYIVILSNDLKNIKEVLYTYRTKDVVEKAFDNIKNELDIKRLKVHTTTSLKGKIFIAFIALIINTMIFKTLVEQKLQSRFSTKDIIKEVEKIHKIRFNNETTMLTEITATQTKIFKAFNINIPK
jgi:transposase